ncbi:MAG TPA: hypothetical protein VM165_23750, partial [Planctomycetaceae bacterium]|nr:hypothetical protein [Planctomycetaceae bacterium]
MRHKGRAWIKQLASQVRRHGKRGASWYVLVSLPSGKRTMRSCGPGTNGKRIAEALRDRTNAQLLLGEYEAEPAPPVPTFSQFAGQHVHAMHGCRLSSVTA